MTSDDMADAAKDTAASLKESAASLSERAGTAASAAGDVASDMAQRVRDHAADLGDKLPNSAGDTMHAGKRAYRSGSDQIARQVGRQPIEALLLAGAIGYLVGWAANRS